MNAQETKVMKMMRIAVPFMLGLALWLLLFWAGSALAQPTVTRGGALKKRQFQTYSAMNLYVNADGGSDYNPCSNAAPCASIQAAVDRIPYWVRHDVTVTVEPIWNPDGGAAGIYTEDVRIAGHRLGNDGASSTTFPRIVVQGSDTWEAANVTGGATGTLTAATNPSTGAQGYLADGTKAWTVGAIAAQNYFVNVTSGGSSLGRSTISANDGTQLGINTQITSVNVGDSYSIEVPSTKLVGSITVENITGQAEVMRGGVVLSRMNVVNVSTTPVIAVRNTVEASDGDEAEAPTTVDLLPLGTVVLHEMRVVSTASGQAAVLCDRAACGFRGANALTTSNTKSAILVTNGTLDLGRLRLLSAYSGGTFGNGVYAAHSRVGASLFTSFTPADYSIRQGFPVLEQLNNTGYAFYGSFTRGYIPYARLRAGSSATSAAYGMRLDYSTLSATFLYCDDVLDTTTYVPTTCIGLFSGSVLRTSTIGGDATGMLLVSQQSQFSAASQPTGGTTTELLIDSTSYTFAAIDALTPRYVQGQVGSIYHRQ